MDNASLLKKSHGINCKQYSNTFFFQQCIRVMSFSNKVAYQILKYIVHAILLEGDVCESRYNLKIPLDLGCWCKYFTNR